jgi:hypothetical protein
MNKNFNEWYLEAGMSLRDEQLKSRWAGVEKKSKKVTADDIINLIKVFYDIRVDESFKDLFAGEFIEFDTAFSRKSERELALLAGAVLVQIAENNSESYSFAELLVSAASFGNRKPAVAGIYQEIERVMFEDMIRIRENSINEEQPSQTSSKSVIKALENSSNGWAPEVATAVINYVKSIDASIKKLNEATITIRKSEEVYFEDSQLLWWLTAGWSRDLKYAYKSIDKQAACLIIGKEAAELVKVFPGPYPIKGVLNKMIENCKKADENWDFVDVIYAVDSEWKRQYNKAYQARDILDLLPISAALARSENTETKDEWITKYAREVCVSVSEMKHSPLEFALQMYFEVLTQKCYCALHLTKE